MAEMAKTVVFKDVGQIEIVEYPIPEIGENDVLIKVDACAICTWEQRVYTGAKKVEFPFIGGHEISGKIIKMGSQVDIRQWHLDDTVTPGVTLPCKNCYQCKSGNEQNCEYFDHSKQQEGLPFKGMGGLSTHMVFNPDNLFKYKGITSEEATIAEPVSCVLHSVETADVQFGDTVVVIGCGIMGLLHVLLANRKGASVIVSDTNDERLKLALKIGAHYAINPIKENLKEKVIEITEGIKAQAVFDTTPIPSVVSDAIECAGNNGRVVLYSSFYPDKPVAFSPDTLHKNAIKIMGTANSNTQDFVKATRLMSEGSIDVKPFISEVYDLKEVQKAFDSAIKGDKFRVIVKL